MEKDVSKYYVVRNIIFGSFFKLFMFILWLVLLIITPIIEPYFKPGKILFSLIIDGYLYYIIYGLRFSFLILAILSLISKNRSSNLIIGMIVIVLTILTIINIFILGTIVILGMIYAGIAFYLTQKLVIMDKTAPVLKFLTKKTVSRDKKSHIFLNLIIEVTLYMIITYYIRFQIIPDSAKTYAFYAWDFGDLVIHAVLFVLVLFIFPRKDSYHQRIKHYFFWLFPIVQISGIFIGLQFFLEESGLISSNIPFILDLVIVILLVLWELIDDIEEKIEDPKKNVNKNKAYTLLLWGYSMTLFSSLNQASGMEDALIFYAFGFVGLGVFLLINKVAKSHSKEFGIVNYSFFNFLFNNLKDSDGNKIGSKKKKTKYSPERYITPTKPIQSNVSQYNTPGPNIQTSYSVKFCSKCGGKIASKDQEFCQNCGEKLPI